MSISFRLVSTRSTFSLKILKEFFGSFWIFKREPKIQHLANSTTFFFFFFFFFSNFNILYDGSRGGRGWLQDSEDRSRTPKNLGVSWGILDDDYLPLLMNSNQLLASSMPATCCPLPPLPVCLCVRVCVSIIDR